MHVVSREAELEQFKSQINLCEYAASRGFIIDRRQSSRSSAVLRHPNGDKLIIARGSNHHWKYFNVHDSRDRGTIIDFIQLRDRSTLGAVRKELRQRLGAGRRPTPTSEQQFPVLLPSSHDVAQVLLHWEQSKPVEATNAYLREQRKIPAASFCNPIFLERLRTDSRQNALFAHYNATGLCGYEIKNRNFTGFSAGGLKGLFCSRPKQNDRELVVCETALDALSYAALHGVHYKRFVSTAGQLSPLQKQLLQSAAKKMPSGSKIILAMDNDDGGQKLIETITQTLHLVDLSEKTLLPHLPKQMGHDWNDVLRQSLRQEFTLPALG